MYYYIKKCWRASALVCLLQIIMCGAQALTNCLLIGLFDAAISLDLVRVRLWVAIDIAGWGLFLLFMFLSETSQAWAIQHYNNTVRTDFYFTLLGKSHREYHAQDTGVYLSWMTNDIKQIEAMAWKPLFACIKYLAQVVWSVLALLSLHWSLAAFSLAVAVVMYAAPKIFTKGMERLGKTCTDEQAAATARLKDLLNGMDVLKFFGRSEWFLQQGHEASDAIERPAWKLGFGKARMEESIGLINIVFQLSSMILCVYLAFKGYVAPAVIAGSVNLIGSVSNGLASFANQRLLLSASKPYFDKITVHAGEAQLPDFGLPTLQEGITVKDVSFCYDEKKPILVNMNAEFKKGGKYALTGPSGCGKSTLLKILLGWLPDYQGKILFDNRDIRDYTPEQLQQQMSYIEQDVFLFNTTIRENITLGEPFTDEQMEKALRDSALAGDLANMPQGLDTPVGEEGSALSGGQKQRVAIARALIHNRSILLVDEGTSALDQKNADIVEKSLLSNPDLTLILISHHLSDERKAQFDHVYELTPASAIA